LFGASADVLAFVFRAQLMRAIKLSSTPVAALGHWYFMAELLPRPVFGN